MITVHHLENSRSQRVLWLLEELALPYTVKHYSRDPQTMLAPESLRAIHPLGKSPVISDDGRVVAESGAIIEYLVARYGQQRLPPPAGEDERLRYTYWLHYAEGSAMMPLLLGLVFRRLPRGPMPFFLRPLVRRISAQVMQRYVAPQIALHLDYMEAQLGASPWFAGEQFSAADIQISFPIEGAEAAGVLGCNRPNLSGFLARIRARPAYQRALEKGGPFVLGERIGEE